MAGTSGFIENTFKFHLCAEKNLCQALIFSAFCLIHSACNNIIANHKSGADQHPLKIIHIAKHSFKSTPKTIQNDLIAPRFRQVDNLCEVICILHKNSF
jgi:hypothetical protein